YATSETALGSGGPSGSRAAGLLEYERRARGAWLRARPRRTRGRTRRLDTGSPASSVEGRKSMSHPALLRWRADEDVTVGHARRARRPVGIRPRVGTNRGQLIVENPGMADDFSERYGDLVTGNYDCVDRIVLN